MDQHPILRRAHPREQLAVCVVDRPRLDTIDTLLRGGGGDYSVRLKNGVKLKVSRTRVEELERRMGVGR